MFDHVARQGRAGRLGDERPQKARHVGQKFGRWPEPAEKGLLEGVLEIPAQFEQ